MAKEGMTEGRKEEHSLAGCIVVFTNSAVQGLLLRDAMKADVFTRIVALLFD